MKWGDRMLYIQDKIMKLNGKLVTGQVGSVEIQETADIQEKTDKEGRTKKTQAVGYKASRVTVTIIFEDTKDQTSLQQLQTLERLFRETKQETPKMMRIVNEDCAARGINKVYIRDFTSKNIISESKRTASLELMVPGTAVLHVIKKAKGVSTSGKSTKKKAKNKSKKNKAKSPAKDTKKTSAAKKKAKKLTKK